MLNTKQLEQYELEVLEFYENETLELIEDQLENREAQSDLQGAVSALARRAKDTGK